LLALASVAHSHMHLFYPPTLKGDNNPHTQGSADPLLNYPYGCCGKEAPGPCKGHLDLLDTDEGKPVATWTAGEKANFTLSGAAITNTDAFNPVGGNHYGGSCQVGFSVDKGKTFKVATTWQGNCPLRHGGEDPSTQSFDFTVPADIPTGDVVFAWTWVNREKEFNMNCASVSIVGGNGETPAPPTTTTPAESPAPTETQYKSPNQPAQYTLEGCSCECPSEQWTSACSCQCESPSAKPKLNAPVRRTETVAFHSRPDMLLDIDFSTASCHSEGTDSELQFPNPGPEVVEGDGEYPLAEP
ncbi:lytic polysaccharide monooxygenase, partial [Melanomma pulvis-pyrius CBS 109.77]